jgi:sporulation protein YlmC with PRC-barrel domain
MGVARNRLDADWLDAGLHLLDRQVVDSEGMLVCNVDDLEVTARAENDLVVTGLLVGPAALWPRLSGVRGRWLGQTWLRLGVQYAGRDHPSYLGLDLVDEITSTVSLTVGRDGVLVPQPDAQKANRHRIGQLLGMTVHTSEGDRLGKVLDVRLQPRGRRTDRRFDVTHLIVGRGRPGSLLGYERGDFRGPWLVRELVIRLHRHTGLVPMGAVQRIDWEDGHLTATGPVGPLS